MCSFRFLLAVLATASFGVEEASTRCPELDPTLVRWTTKFANGEPTGDVTIVDPLLLDTSPKDDIVSITVIGNGRLVWDPTSDIHLRIRYMLIKDGGRVDIGSEDCKYERKTSITLYGNRNELNIEEFHEKFIGVAAGGTLEIHGREKLSWTKLRQTLPKVSPIYQYSTNKEHNTGWKPMVAWIYNSTGQVRYSDFGVSGGWSKGRENARNDMIQFINDAEDGDYLMICKKSTIKVKYLSEMTVVWDALKTKIGSQSLLAYNMQHKKNAYAFVAKIGDPNSVNEKVGLEPDANEEWVAKASLSSMDIGRKFEVENMFSTNYAKTVEMRITDTDYSSPVLNLTEDVTSWDDGDDILVVSTDYDWKQSEVGTIIECPQCSNKQVRLDLDQRFHHFGEIVDNVDMRGEVALLTRNILIQGEVQDRCLPQNKNCKDTRPKPTLSFPEDTFGGHLKVTENFTDVHIEGAELKHMGQQTDLGRYATHFHMCLDVGPSRYRNPPYIKHNSIHHIFSRCVTVHGTHHLSVIGNVCYRTYGHSYFLEDGGEQFTVFDGNLAAGTMPGAVIAADRHPTSFWITNPKTTMTNNVAAGGEGTGYWYVYPEYPMGPSTPYNMMEPGEAKRTPILKNFNNVGHSYFNTGLNVDQTLNVKTGDFGGINNYTPKDEDGNLVKVYFESNTYYKNGIQSVWTRGTHIVFTQLSIADTPKGITMAGTINFCEKSVILGETKNKGEPKVTDDFTYDRSRPTWDATRPMSGIQWYDGPTYYSDMYFNYFTPTTMYDSYALGFRRKNPFQNSVTNQVKGLMWGYNDLGYYGSASRVFDGVAPPTDDIKDSRKHYGDEDGDMSATFWDVDGSVNGVPGWFLKNRPFITTDHCMHRPNQNDTVFCPHEYGKLDFMVDKLNGKKSPVTMVRDDNEATMTLTGERSSEFPVILGGDTSYMSYFTEFVPKKFKVMGRGIKKDYPVRFGVCIGKDVDFTMGKRSQVDKWGIGWDEVFDIQSLDAATKMTTYFYDRNIGAIFFKMQSYLDRAGDTISECPGGQWLCPYLEVTINNGYGHFFDCISQAYSAGYQRLPTKWSTYVPREDEHVIPANFPNGPPEGIGAGPTKPFRNSLIVDGGFGRWGEWSSCSVTCGGGGQSRRRQCNNPLPTNGGKPCTGEFQQEQQCNTETCPPVHGGFSDWAKSECIAGPGGSCYQEWTRRCDSPEPSNSGLYCDGAALEVHPCDCTIR